MLMSVSQESKYPIYPALPRDDAADPEATPSERILSAVEMISLHGPMTYKALETSLNLTKTATWRLVATLREANWVRFRHGGRLIELDPRLDELFASAHFADTEFIEVAEVMSLVGRKFKVHLDLFSPNRKGDLVLHETSRRLTITAPVPDAIDEGFALAVHAAMSQPQLERHLASISAGLDIDTARHMRSTEARRRIQEFPGYFWSPSKRFVAASVSGKLGSPAVIRIAAKANAIKPEVLANAFETLTVLLQGKVQMLARGQKTIIIP